MGPVDDNLASVVVAQLLFLQSESAKKPIHMYINSPGGSVTAGMTVSCFKHVCSITIHCFYMRGGQDNSRERSMVV